MTTTKDEYREEARGMAAQLEVQLSALDDLPDLPGWAQLFGPEIINFGFRIDIPYDPAKLGQIRALLSDSWRFIRTSGTYNGNVESRFVHTTEEIVLSVFSIATLPGSTCERVKVGERLEPIYEVRCGSCPD